MSELLKHCLESTKLEDALNREDTSRLAAEIESLTGLTVYPLSITVYAAAIYFMARSDHGKVIAVLSGNEIGTVKGTASTVDANGEQIHLLVGELDRDNAAAMRETFPFLRPVTLGLRKSAGCGDRLGLATPGHVRAVRNSSMAPIFAQQSIRENARTGRTPQEVMDDALWGVLEEGWRAGFGADADHLKNTDDIDACAAAGFTFFTIDPGEYVDNVANTASLDVLRKKVAELPWTDLESSWDATTASLGSNPVDLGPTRILINEEDLLRATAKYGRVVAHTAKMYRHLSKVMNGRPFELEMSVDETETVTTVAEHIYIAHELKRLGVKWVSLAPRYVGDFEKGVDYIGDLSEFESSFASHLAVARAFGPYKLSLHSGSDKFSIYPIASRLAGDLVHLKTAGTSYLEALRAIGVVNPVLFREIVRFARDRYATDRASYHVSAEVAKMPDITSWPDSKLTDLLDDFHAREVLHVTFGSVLHNPQFRERFFESLERNEETYAQILERHFHRHLSPFGEAGTASGD